MNTIKTMVLMILLTLLLVATGELFAGRVGLGIGLGFAVVLNFAAYWYSDRFAVALTRAKPATENELPHVYELLRRLTSDVGLPMPRVYLIPSQQPNAFAAGRNPHHSVVAVTQGLVDTLDDRQLQGVLAHELAHIRNRDILISTVAAVMAGALAAVARLGMWQLMLGGRARRQGSQLISLLGIIMIILAPVAALLIRMAVSRTREYEADKTAAQLTRDPQGLAQALNKLSRGASRNSMNVNEATAHMFIVSPLAGSSLASLFSTHPPITERIRRLEDLSYL